MYGPRDWVEQVEYEPQTDTYRTAVDWERTDPVSTAVVDAVADVMGVPPGELPPLHRSVEPDALDRLFRPRPGQDRRESGYASFQFGGCLVVVTGDGEVVVG